MLAIHSEAYKTLLQVEPFSFYLIFFMLLSLGISLGVFIALIYLTRRVGRISEGGASHDRFREFDERIKKLEEAEKNTSSMLTELHNSVKNLQESFIRIDSRVTALESKTVLLERRFTREVKEVPRPVSYPRVPQHIEAASIKELNELALHYPEVKYACIITSQGYVVKSYGQPSEEPPKILEILRISRTPRVSLVRGDRVLEVFYLGDVKDLSVYAILEVEDSANVNEARLDAIKETINRYFRDIVSKAQ